MSSCTYTLQRKILEAESDLLELAVELELKPLKGKQLQCRVFRDRRNLPVLMIRFPWFVGKLKQSERAARLIEDKSNNDHENGILDPRIRVNPEQWVNDGVKHK